jgi:hypothetical protein
VPGFYWHIDAAMLRSGEFTSPWRGKPAATIWPTARWAIGFAFPCHSPLVTALCGFGIFSSLFTLHSSLLFPLFLNSAACRLGNRRKAADRRLRFWSAATRRRFPSPQLDAAIQPPLTSQRQKKREQAPALRNFEPQVREFANLDSRDLLPPNRCRSADLEVSTCRPQGRRYKCHLAIGARRYNSRAEDMPL